MKRNPAIHVRQLRHFALAAAVVVSAGTYVRADEASPSQTPPVESAKVAEALFFDQVAPLLRQKCAGCHGDADSREGGFLVTSRDTLLAGGDRGEPAIVPGDAKASPLYVAVTWSDEDLQMPPKEVNRLTDVEVAAIRRWIDAGAPWPKERTEPPAAAAPEWDPDAAEGVTVATSGGLSPEWTNRKYKPEALWAFRPVVRHEVPWDALAPGAKQHPIDAFLQAKLSAAGFSPAAEADRRTLLRRATFDLTGLPPSPEEADAFVADESPRAYEELVERLLASPHYGEQMARNWLDVTRYADTNGFANDYERPSAWRYRDYVIRSFNRDKPYDRFVVEQLAGDELDPEDPELLIAVGYLRSGPWEHTGMSVAAETRQQFLDDVTHAVGVTFLGQGLRCARCHDHKFDPIPTRDYYRIQAVFAPVQFAEREVPFQPWENVANFEAGMARSKRLIEESKAVLNDLSQKNKRALAEYLKERGAKTINDLPIEERSNSRFFGLTALDKSLQKIYSKRVAYFEREMIRYEPVAFSVYSGPSNGYSSVAARVDMPAPEKRRGPAETVHILAGGSLAAPLDEVKPGVLSAVFGSNDTVMPVAWNTLPQSTEGRRLALARWIASPNNALTARVIVNRVWQWHFGTGIVATSNNFGSMGARPTHPELLDWLANWFVEHDWSIKDLHRLIMTSAAYREAGHHDDFDKLQEVDSRNALLAYFPPRRLTAEQIRDSMLAVTGELNPTMGGPGVYPEINWEVARQPRHIMGSVAPAYQPSPLPEERHRRAIYAFRYRTLSDPMLEVFNQPTSDISCERRDETTVTPQVFALFNGQFVHDRALALANRAVKESTDPDERIDLVFRLAYGRAPSDDERRWCAEHLAEMTAYHRDHPPKKETLPTTVRREMVEELTGEAFTWEEPLDLMKDYVEDLKPWDVDAETRALAEVCLVLLNSNEFVYIR